MNELWQRFGLWLFDGIMPPPRPWWRLMMAMEGLRRELGESLVPAMKDLVVVVGQLGKAMERLEITVEDEG